MGSALFLQLSTNTSQLVGNKFSAIGITSFLAHINIHTWQRWWCVRLLLLLQLLLDSKGERTEKTTAQRKRPNKHR